MLVHFFLKYVRTPDIFTTKMCALDGVLKIRPGKGPNLIVN
jgi:hypothetical protein